VNSHHCAQLFSTLLSTTLFAFSKKTPTGVSVFYSALSGNLMWRMRYVTAPV